MSPDGNLLLRNMAVEDFRLLEPLLERVMLDEGDVIATAGERIESLCFMEDGVASYSSLSPQGVRTGIGMVGFEGCVGWQILLGSDIAPYDIMVAVGGGSSLRVDADDLLDLCERRPALRSLLMRFVQSVFAQIGQTAVSNVNDAVQGRLCRWLLMNHDRLEGDEIQVSHNEIGNMLGVRRASVTDALHILEGDGLISAKRKSIVVRDRLRLRECAGDSYGFAEAEYRRLVGPFGKDI